jgi:imidazolonepropionase-like amidohydrolase
MIGNKLVLALFLLCSIPVIGQNTEIQTPPNGVSDELVQTIAFTHANIQASPTVLLMDATLLIRGSKILAVGKNVTIPSDAQIIDLKGKWIFPSFIDLNSHYGIPKAPKKKYSRMPIMESPLAYKSYWNKAIHPEYDASNSFFIDKKEATKLRSSGFGLVLSHQKNGIARGSSVLVDLGTKRPVLVDKAATHYSFSKGNSNQDYPSSMMGSMALIRQLFTDLDWYKSNNNEPDLSLEAMKKTEQLPMFFESRDYQENIRAQKLANESGRSFIVMGKGDSRKDIPGLVQYQTKMVVPVWAEKPLNLDQILDLDDLSLNRLQNWKYSPYNALLLQNGGIPLAITFEGHQKSSDFFSSLQRIIRYGMTREAVLTALTTTPASWVHMENLYGKLEEGYTANFFISSKDVISQKGLIFQHWIRGENYQYHSLEIPDLQGQYSLYVDGDTMNLIISGSFEKAKAKIGADSNNMSSAKITWKENGLSIRFKNYIFLGSQEGQNMKGVFTNNSAKGNWSAILNKKTKQDAKPLALKTLPASPQAAYVYQNNKATYLIKNCTVWTCEKQGIVANMDVFVKDGKISKMGQNLNVPNVPIIDGTGKHLTPGIIDEHSHIAVKRGVNESSQSITAEVRIQDVINAKDVNIYRQVAGGTTTSHILHGSANAIGGQTALIKLKYGSPVRDLLFKTDHRFIKFALGENVKQSNWGDSKTTRFPQTRMGVEQVFMDGFTRALTYSELRKTNAIKVDWELEALVEIIDGKRFITCHSYQQGEINMLMHVADSFGFRVNTFTHVLEGYKLAGKLKAHGAAASTFSDWWSYKFEVNDAIPFNAALLQQAGVLTGINSDDAETGRRLNQEAAKAVKYGGLSEEDALKLITINPAKMLHIDKSVGSIALGKDADLVLWDGNPLSIYAQVNTTWIDGVIYFNIEQDLEERKRIDQVKLEIMKAMRKDKSDSKEFKPKPHKHYHCDSIEQE